MLTCLNGQVQVGFSCRHTLPTELFSDAAVIFEDTPPPCALRSPDPKSHGPLSELCLEGDVALGEVSDLKTYVLLAT